jgi:hypothetical protein
MIICRVKSLITEVALAVMADACQHIYEFAKCTIFLIMANFEHFIHVRKWSEI